ncbi:SCO family protein [Aquihabitans sp. G128]|uniref:SCO family protein n=1 Tax=Aquihabitans sp. G128 TaxID=2849779 RepID=UPI001C234ABE|nr:SCO family protein [Aquihabitans sp. G128]QXC62546.1 SCO family protein [Aquihabitans sp. G128]
MTAAPTPPWSRRRVLGFGAAGAAALALGACSLDRGSSPDTDAEPEPKGDWSGTLLDPPFPKPDFTFTDVDGKPYPIVEKTKGKLTILFYGYTNCPDVCPITLNTLARAKDGIGSGPGSNPLVLFVGVDVDRDTPEVLKTYLNAIDPEFVGLTPTGKTKAEKEAMIVDSLAVIKQAAPEIGEPDEDGNYIVGHPSAVTVYTADDVAHRLYPSNVRQSQWVKDLPRLDKGTYT